MTGSLRLGGAPGAAATRLWTAMRETAAPWTADDIAATGDVSVHYARRTIAALRAAGLIETVDEAGHGGRGRGPIAATYPLTAPARRQHQPPQLANRGPDGSHAVHLRDSDMTGDDLLAAWPWLEREPDRRDHRLSRPARGAAVVEPRSRDDPARAADAVRRFLDDDESGHHR